MTNSEETTAEAIVETSEVLDYEDAENPTAKEETTTVAEESPLNDGGRKPAIAHPALIGSIVVAGAAAIGVGGYLIARGKRKKDGE
ncbi:MAG: hypothetical protein IJ744_02215 [Lachnospiraceae bacterium]|nr:hypothetical protein [Lachnospiraceae bacterium]